MLFAAGFGTRMGALTADRPKPLLPVAGRPLIDHALALADAAGITHIVANAHYRAAQITAHLAPRGIPVSVESPEILDTGGGLKAALPLLGPGPLITLNTDAVWTGPNPLDALRLAWDGRRMGALLTLVPVAAAVGRAPPGDFTLQSDGQIVRGGDMVYAGAQAICPQALDGIDAAAFSLNRVWDALAARGQLFGTVHPGGWCDVGHPAGLALAEAMLAEAGDA